MKVVDPVKHRWRQVARVVGALGLSAGLGWTGMVWADAAPGPLPAYVLPAGQETRITAMLARPPSGCKLLSVSLEGSIG